MQKFIVDSYMDPEFSGEFETDKSIDYVFDDLQRGMYHMELINPKNNIPVIRFYGSSLGSNGVYDYLISNYKLLTESPEYEFKIENSSETISINGLETSSEPIEEIKKFLNDELGINESELDFTKTASYIGADAEFANLIINVSGGLITYGASKIIEALSQLGIEAPIHRKKSEYYKKYIEERFEVNKNNLAFVSESENHITYTTRRTTYTLTLDEKGKVKDSSKNDLTQTGI